MDNSKKPAGSEHLRLCSVIEVGHVGRGAYPGVYVYLSLPGREDPVVKSWTGPYGMISAAQLLDLKTWVAQTVGTSVVQFCGVQESLELG